MIIPLLHLPFFPILSSLQLPMSVSYCIPCLFPPASHVGFLLHPTLIVGFSPLPMFLVLSQLSIYTHTFYASFFTAPVYILLNWPFQLSLFTINTINYVLSSSLWASVMSLDLPHRFPLSILLTLAPISLLLPIMHHILCMIVYSLVHNLHLRRLQWHQICCTLQVPK